MFTTSEKSKPNAQNITGLSLAAVKHTINQVIRQSLKYELHEL
jgi:hypothetical protein